jgi:FAD/FMN-containing dehydrogenase
VIDTSRYLTEIVEINQEEKTAIVEPGVLLTAFNRTAGKQGLKFGPDPASADRATVGGSVANNATGAHSILYGMSADQLPSVEVVLSDGSETTFEEITIDRARQIAANGNGSVEAAIYQTALDIRDHHAAAIKAGWPQVWRRASGYNLNYLLPWSPVQPDSWEITNERPYPPVKEGHINLAPLVAGSEGTLAVIKQVKLNLVPILKTTILGVLRYPSIPEACDAVPGLLEQFKPSALELMPGELIDLWRADRPGAGGAGVCQAAGLGGGHAPSHAGG